MNTNCLKGVMCPECGHTERFIIDATCMVTVTDDGTSDEREIEWDQESACMCGSCDNSGTVGDFKIPGFDVTFEIVTPESAEHGDADRRGWWMPGEWLFDVEDKPGELAFEFDPDDYDPEEHEDVQDAVVEWACSILKRNGAYHASQYPSDGAEWWSTEPDTHSFETGEDITKSFHFVGFTDEQQREINRRMA